MESNQDQEILKVFRQLRQEEKSFIPSFQSILQKRGLNSHKPPFRLWLRPALILLLTTLISAPLIYNFLRGPEISDLDKATQVEEWESPTDFLLTFVDQPYATSIPTIGTTIWVEQESFEDLENFE
jgi:hypothetical protein